jgi:hypothetical protein
MLACDSKFLQQSFATTVCARVEKVYHLFEHCSRRHRVGHASEYELGQCIDGLGRATRMHSAPLIAIGQDSSSKCTTELQCAYSDGV